MKRMSALTAAVALSAAIVTLPGGAGATAERPGAPEVPAITGSGAVPDIPIGSQPAIIPALPVVAVPAFPAVLPAPVREILPPPVPAQADDEHMAELCAAREVFCQVDSSGHYTGS